MPHLDPDRLVLIALGEQDPSTSENEHLHSCAICGADLDATRATITVGREAQHVQALPAPSEELWARIAGSAVKFCFVAEGSADLYPRFGPTMEWDTAAGQALLEAAGGSVTGFDGTRFRYAKPGFRNPEFLAKGRD